MYLGDFEAVAKILVIQKMVIFFQKSPNFLPCKAVNMFPKVVVQFLVNLDAKPL